jgi:hypothetical protein
MTTELQTNAGEPAFVTVGVLETKCATPGAKVRANIASARARGLPRLHQLTDYGKFKGVPLAIVAGGPSLDSTLDELRALDCPIMVCGSAHDAVMERGFVPQYAAFCDAHVSTADFIRHADHRCTYLVASGCDPIVFDHLKDHRVVLWHNNQGDMDCLGDEAPFAINGGCTITLRAISIAIMLGYMDLHFFGLDSSFKDKQYAYEGNPDAEIIINARAGDRVFLTQPCWLAQATHFAEMYRNMSHLFTPTVHGDGLIAAMMNQGDYA